MQELTELQLSVGLTQAPVHVAVAVSLLEQVVQNFPDILPLVDHQGLRAAVVQQHLHHQLSEKCDFILILFYHFTSGNSCIKDKFDILAESSMTRWIPRSCLYGKYEAEASSRLA